MRCPYLGTIRPRRERETGEAAKKTSTSFVLLRSPRRSRSRISEPSRILASRGRPSPTPCASTLLAADLHNDLRAPTLPATVQRLATAGRLHTRPKAVLVYPLAVARLVCRLHSCQPDSWVFVVFWRAWEDSQRRSKRSTDPLPITKSEVQKRLPRTVLTKAETGDNIRPPRLPEGAGSSTFFELNPVRLMPLTTLTPPQVTTLTVAFAECEES